MKPILLLDEAYGENEEKLGVPFVGASGAELIRMLSEANVLDLTAEDQDYVFKYYKTRDPQMLDNVWRMHPELYRTNVFNLHPTRNKIESLCGPKASALSGYPAITKGKYAQPLVTLNGVLYSLEKELDRLADEIIAIDPNLIVALGNTPLWALCGTTGVSKLRGTTRLSTHTVTGYKVLATYHPNAVNRQWELRPVTIADLMKAKRESLYPDIRRPSRAIWIDPTIEDLDAFFDLHIHGCAILSVDIETSGDQITEIGFAPSPDIALVLPFKDTRKKDGNYWPTKELELRAWGFVGRILEDRGIRKVFQNGLYDIAFIWRSTGIMIYGASEDTMLLQHALQPEMLKGLGYLGSVYTNEGAWKSERKFKTTIKRDD